MTINNATTKKNLDEFISLTMNEGKKLGFSKSQLDDLYKNAIDVFFFNDLEKAPKISKQVVDYFWCGMNLLYYQNGREVAKMLLKDMITVDNVKFNKETPNGLDAILNSVELPFLLALNNKDQLEKLLTIKQLNVTITM